jgi:hypothetical protein
MSLEMWPLVGACTCPSLYMIPEWIWSSNGMIPTGGTEELGRKPVPVPCCPPHIPLWLPWEQTQASMVRRQQRNSCAMTQPTIRLQSKTLSSDTSGQFADWCMPTAPPSHCTALHAVTCNLSDSFFRCLELILQCIKIAFDRVLSCGALFFMCRNLLAIISLRKWSTFVSFKFPV